MLSTEKVCLASVLVMHVYWRLFFPGSIWPAAMLDLRLLSHVGRVGSDRVKLVLDKQYAML